MNNAAICSAILLGHPDDSPVSGATLQRIVDLADEYGSTLQFGVTADFAAQAPEWMKRIQAQGHAVDGYLPDIPPNPDRKLLEARLEHLETVLAEHQVEWWGLIVDRLEEDRAREVVVPTLMQRGYRWMCTPIDLHIQPYPACEDFFVLPRVEAPTAEGSITETLASQGIRVSGVRLGSRWEDQFRTLLAEVAKAGVPYLKLNEIADITLAASQASPQARERVSVQAYLHYRDYWDRNIGPSQQAYKIFDYRGGWRLKPGYYRNTSGKWERLSVPDRQQGFQINRHGFRGEMFPHHKEAGETRIIAVGDSCVFGVAGEDNSWPARAGVRIDELSGGAHIRVINAGIEGQSSAHCWMRIKRLLSFEPDVLLVTVLANDLFIEDPGDYLEITTPEYATSWEVIGEYPRTRWMSAAIQGQRRSMTLRDFHPYNYARHLRQIIREARDADVLPVLMTSPPLLPADPSLAGAEHLMKMHHPPFVPQGDMSTMRRLYEIYNHTVRELAAEAGIPLVDGEKYFRESHDHQRHELFSDTCHPTVRGNLLLGSYVGEQLWKILQERG